MVTILAEYYLYIILHCYLSFTFLNYYLCLYVCLHEFLCVERLDGVGRPRTGVIGSCELVDVGNQTQVLCKNTKCSY